MFPLNYDLCCQCVTVYRLEDGSVKRYLLENVHYQYDVRQVTDQRGRHQETMCLLIVPGDRDIRVGDRVYDGIGPDVNVSQWKNFLPVTVAGLSEINYVKPWFWEGQLCHREAGRR